MMEEAEGVGRVPVFSPTMQLRWIESKFANDPKNSVPFTHAIGWGWPDNVVLQQLWRADTGETKWEDVKLELPHL